MRRTITAAVITTAEGAARAAKAYQDAEMRVLRLAVNSEEQLYKELAKRYADYNSPEARQRRQWDAEAAEYRSMTGY